jgi:hypothetical protein
VACVRVCVIVREGVLRVRVRVCARERVWECDGLPVRACMRVCWCMWRRNKLLFEFLQLPEPDWLSVSLSVTAYLFGHRPGILRRHLEH